MTSENERVELGRLLAIPPMIWAGDVEMGIVVHIHDYFWVDVLCCDGLYFAFRRDVRKFWCCQ